MYTLQSYELRVSQLQTRRFKICKRHYISILSEQLMAIKLIE